MSKSPNPKHREYTNKDIVVMALCRLGGSVRHVHLEDVAIKAAELSPRRFCWSKYPDQIDLESVRISLKNELASEGRRILGSIRHGWMLTPHGLKWYLSTAGSSEDRGFISELDREIDRAKKTAAFSKTIASRGHEVTLTDANALLRADEYSTVRNRRERVLALANAAVLDSQLRWVLSDLKERGFNELEVEK